MDTITREEFNEISEDLKKIKNDLNTVKANTQISANLLSILHGDDIADIVFTIANTERLCKALIYCSEPRTAKQLCEVLGVKAPNIRKQVIDKLVSASLLTVVDTKGRSETYQRALFLNMINFDRLARKKYSEIGL